LQLKKSIMSWIFCLWKIVGMEVIET
jgi:hypothetical protein